MTIHDFANTGFWFKTLLCILCGMIVGAERQWHKKPIDIRTSVLICLGTMTFIYLGTLLDGEKDSTRVLGQVVTGIGFLGAGAIITRQGLVAGMTSASVVWVLAAIGSAIGLHHYAIGISISVVTVVVLTGLHWIDDLVMRATDEQNGSNKTLS